MTWKRTIGTALAGVVVAAGVAQGAWFFQNGRWYYTPDIGSEVTVQRDSNADAVAVWTLETASYAFACLDAGGLHPEAEEVEVVRSATLSTVVNIPKAANKQHPEAIVVRTHFDTGSLALDSDCHSGGHAQNSDRDPLGDTVLVHEFTGTISVNTCQHGHGPRSCTTTVAQETYRCVLPAGTSPLNLPDTSEEREYSCTLIQ